MNEIVLAEIQEPISQELTTALYRVINPHPDTPHDLPSLSITARVEVGKRLRALNIDLGVTATMEHWQAFLRPLVFSVGNAPTREEFAAKVSSIAFGLGHMPAGILTERRSAEALRRFKFWPSVSELGDWLSPLVAALRAERRALERLRDAPDVPQPTKGERTDAERSHVAAAARAFAADMAALNKPKAGVAAQSRPAHPQHLLMAYEQIAAERTGVEGNAARTRVEALRRQVEAERQ